MDGGSSVIAMVWRLRRLTITDVITVASVIALGIAVEIGLRTMRLHTLTRLLHVRLDQTSSRPNARADGLTAAAYRRMCITYRVMQHSPFDEKCLRRSLVAACLIRKCEPALVIGVALAGDGVKAHAWLRVNGADLDPAATQFHVLHAIATE
jgi:hypothetical protein